MSQQRVTETPALPAGIETRHVDNGHGLTMHLLEAGHRGDPLILLLHGFPELAYSWRKVLVRLAQAGFYVIAPDQRGFGHTTGWDGDYDGDLASYTQLSLVRDAMGLVAALGYRTVDAVVGHDMGSTVAGYCALARPDVFRSVAFMSAPFAGPPAFAFDTAEQQGDNAKPHGTDISATLAALDPPRKHYQHYFRSRQAAADMLAAPQGVHAFLRAYFHTKSADWPGNAPAPLQALTASELATLPGYYVMQQDKTMPETVGPEMPTPEQIAACQWLPDAELAVYAETFCRTGFQGALQWYRAFAEPAFQRELYIVSGRTVDMPSCFIAGKKDWGIYQFPGRFERMRDTTCTRMLGCHLIPGAGHWVQQEQPEAVTAHLLTFFEEARRLRTA
ncbi:alpha/beta hydrolase [Aquisalimonas sp.]|uniref:alpha/beta hydrolase n=1 Tax=Aquisalimonas sp. TaxID=1872621 RepID=UPI0025B9DB7F|nr:alpha/beta hydrolase [Aquisalimonas sp.]